MRKKGVFPAAVGMVSLLYGFTLFFALDRHPLPGFDDALYAHEAKDLLRRNAFLDVRFNGYVRYENPPLFDWILLLFFRTCGVSDLVARLPGAVVAWLMFWLLLAVCRELRLDKRSQLLTLLVFSSSGYFVQYARRCMTDVPFAGLVLLAIWLLLKSRQRPYLLPVAFLVGGATALLKSAFALLLLVFFILTLIRHRKNWALSWPLLTLSLTLFFIPFGAWVGAIHSQHGWSPIGAHFIASKMQGELRPLNYMINLFGRYQPWYLLWLFGLLLNLRRLHKFVPSFLILWTTSFLLPLSVVPAQVTRYLLAIFPAMALTVVSPSLLLLRRDQQRIVVRVVFCLYTGAVSLFAIWPGKLDRPVDSSFSNLVSEMAPCEERVLLFEVPLDRRNEFLWYSDCYAEEISDQSVLNRQLTLGRVALIPSSLALQDTRKLGETQNWALVTR